MSSKATQGITRQDCKENKGEAKEVEQEEEHKQQGQWEQLSHNTLNDTTSDWVSKSRGRTALVKVETSTMTLIEPSRDLIVSAELDTNASIFSI